MTVLAHDYCNHFLTWQCRIRQIAMREDGGRPSEGMRPRVRDMAGNLISEGIIVLLVRENPFESTEFLKFQVQKHNDPQDVYKKALSYLQSTHYHRAIEFSDEMTGLFAASSKAAARFVDEKDCVLEFAQFSQRYALPCSVNVLSEDDPAYQATLWHNRVFNPNIGSDIVILGFRPDWDKALSLLDPAA